MTNEESVLIDDICTAVDELDKSFCDERSPFGLGALRHEVHTLRQEPWKLHCVLLFLGDWMRDTDDPRLEPLGRINVMLWDLYKLRFPGVLP